MLKLTYELQNTRFNKLFFPVPLQVFVTAYCELHNTGKISDSENFNKRAFIKQKGHNEI